jgi:hypothetical protein
MPYKLDSTYRGCYFLQMTEGFTSTVIRQASIITMAFAIDHLDHLVLTVGDMA